jgi:hypothetical protein
MERLPERHQGTVPDRRPQTRHGQGQTRHGQARNSQIFSRNRLTRRFARRVTRHFARCRRRMVRLMSTAFADDWRHTCTTYDVRRLAERRHPARLVSILVRVGVGLAAADLAASDGFVLAGFLVLSDEAAGPRSAETAPRSSSARSRLTAEQLIRPVEPRRPMRRARPPAPVPAPTAPHQHRTRP